MGVSAVVALVSHADCRGGRILDHHAVDLCKKEMACGICPYPRFSPETWTVTYNEEYIGRRLSVLNLLETEEYIYRPPSFLELNVNENESAMST
jgi:hypothetical protein